MIESRTTHTPTTNPSAADRIPIQVECRFRPLLTSSPDLLGQSTSVPMTSFFRRLLPFLLVLWAAGLLYPRLDNLRDVYSGRLLWAEDVAVFMPQAESMGLAAIGDLYAGYMHLYPRLVAWIGSHFSLLDRPAVYFTGWMLAYLLMVWVLIRTARDQGWHWFSVAAMLAAVALQPQNGEVLFNITNAQWMLGVPLFLIAIWGTRLTRSKTPWLEVVLLLLMSFTGPFSAFLTPALLLRMVVQKDGRSCAWIYGPVFVGALAQALMIIVMGRATYLQGWAPVTDFVQTAWGVFSFGAHDLPTGLATAAFWGVLTYGVWSARHPVRFRYWLTLLAVATLYAGILYSVRPSPLSSIAFGIGNRFSWIPYTLLIFIAFDTTAHRPWRRLVLLAALAVICHTHFQKITNVDFGFRQLVKLSQWRKVEIPMNPPGMVGMSIGPASPVSPELWPLAKFSPWEGMQAHMLRPQGELSFVTEGSDPYIVFGTPAQCPGAGDIVVVIDMTRDVDGILQLYWLEETATKFTERASIQRWHPDGRIQVELGLHLQSRSARLRLDPTAATGASVQLHGIHVFCLD